MHRNAPEPLILQAWVWALGRTILSDELGPNYLEFLDGGIYTIERLIANGSAWCDDTTKPDETESCNIQTNRALETAPEHLGKRFGSDSSASTGGGAEGGR